MKSEITVCNFNKTFVFNIPAKGGLNEEIHPPFPGRNCEDVVL